MAETIVGLRLLVFDDQLLSRSQSGTVWGRIYFDFGGQQFPDTGWSDLVVVVANAWLEAVLQIAAGAKSTEKVHFMDGPAAVTISSGAPGLVNVSFTHKDIVMYSIASRLDEVLRDAISTGERLVGICRRHGWSDSPDCFRLSASVENGIRSAGGPRPN